MNISAKTEYACIAALELAVNYGSSEPVRIRDIAEKHGIPSRFLVQILLQLKGAGLANSTRGASGGYRLAQDPRNVTLLDVMSVIEGPMDAMTGSASEQTPQSRVLLGAWNEISAVQKEMLANITFAELAEKTQGEAESMYYI